LSTWSLAQLTVAGASIATNQSSGLAGQRLPSAEIHQHGGLQSGDLVALFEAALSDARTSTQPRAGGASLSRSVMVSATSGIDSLAGRPSSEHEMMPDGGTPVKGGSRSERQMTPESLADPASSGMAAVFGQLMGSTTLPESGFGPLPATGLPTTEFGASPDCYSVMGAPTGTAVTTPAASDTPSSLPTKNGTAPSAAVTPTALDAQREPAPTSVGSTSVWFEPTHGSVDSAKTGSQPAFSTIGVAMAGFGVSVEAGSPASPVIGESASATMAPVVDQMEYPSQQAKWFPGAALGTGVVSTGPAQVGTFAPATKAQQDLVAPFAIGSTADAQQSVQQLESSSVGPLAWTVLGREVAQDEIEQVPTASDGRQAMEVYGEATRDAHRSVSGRAESIDGAEVQSRSMQGADEHQRTPVLQTRAAQPRISSDPSAEIPKDQLRAPVQPGRAIRVASPAAQREATAQLNAETRTEVQPRLGEVSRPDSVARYSAVTPLVVEASPDAAVRPGATARPDMMARPDVTARPEAETRSEAQARPSEVSRPDSVARHSAVTRSVAEAPPDAAVRPGATARPDMMARPDVTARPEAETWSAAEARPTVAIRPHATARLDVVSQSVRKATASESVLKDASSAPYETRAHTPASPPRSQGAADPSAQSLASREAPHLSGGAATHGTGSAAATMQNTVGRTAGADEPQYQFATQPSRLTEANSLSGQPFDHVSASATQHNGAGQAEVTVGRTMTAGASETQRRDAALGMRGVSSRRVLDAYEAAPVSKGSSRRVPSDSEAAIPRQPRARESSETQPSSGWSQQQIGMAAPHADEAVERYAPTGETTEAARPRSVVDQVVSKVSYEALANKSCITIGLEPERLGSIEVRVELENGRVLTSIAAETDEARRALKSATDRLVSALRDQGIDASEVRVSSMHAVKPDSSNSELRQESEQWQQRDSAAANQQMSSQGSWDQRGHQGHEAFNRPHSLGVWRNYGLEFQEMASDSLLSGAAGDNTAVQLEYRA
jgi:flagellar hook-length control protein FliK